MSKYQPYSEYKDSGVEWLDEVPEHWSIASLKMLVDVRDGTHDTPPYVEINDHSYPLITSKDVTSGALRFVLCKHISHTDYLSIIKRSKVDIGDILMPMIGTVGSPIVVNDRNDFAIKNLALFKTSSNININTSFLNYFLQSSECKIQFSLESRGGVQNFVSLGVLRDLGFPKLPADEQQKIANFLDCETTKIDTLIEKQQELIELLKEKRQAVISHAVTKGLDPNVKMKDSSVEWLGDVPEHWEVCKLKYYWKVVDCKHITAPFIDQGIPLASIKEVQHWEVDLSNAKQTTEEFYKKLIEGNRKPEPNDIIYSRNATVGEAAIVTDRHPRFAMGQDVCMLKPLRKVSGVFLLYFLKSNPINLQLNHLMIGATFKRINVEDIRSFELCLPAIQTQEKIVTYLDTQTSKINTLIEKAYQGITLLKERRIALISSAVTGKIDVRKVN